MPARNRCAGEWIAPHDRMISRPRNSVSPPADARLHADAALARRTAARRLRVGGDRQVLAHPRAGIEVADRRRHPPFIDVGNGDRKIPVAELGILVDQEVVAGLLERLARRLRMFRPQIGKDAAHRDAALLAVPRTVEVHVALDLLEEGQHVVPVPTGRAARVPLVVVGRRAAIGELPVDRRSAAQHARLFIGAPRRAWRVGPVVRDDLGGDLQLVPGETRIEIGRAGIGIENLLRHLAMRRVLPGFQQQHAIGTARRQPVGQHRSCRPAADDDVVVVRHISPLPLREGVRGRGRSGYDPSP